MTRKLASLAFAATLVLTLGACSKSSDTSTTNTAAPATTAKTTEKTEKKSSDSGDSTETTKKSTATTKKSSGSSSSGGDSALKSQVQALDKSLGIDLTDDEIQCLAGKLADNPSLNDISGTPTASQATALFDAISSCIPKDKFINLVGNQLEKSGTYTASQISCIKNKLADLSADEMAQLAAQTPEAVQKFGPIFAECQKS